MVSISIFFFNETATTEIYTYVHTLSLHDALPISGNGRHPADPGAEDPGGRRGGGDHAAGRGHAGREEGAEDVREGAGAGAEAGREHGRAREIGRAHV